MWRNEITIEIAEFEIFKKQKNSAKFKTLACMQNVWDRGQTRSRTTHRVWTM